MQLTNTYEPESVQFQEKFKTMNHYAWELWLMIKLTLTTFGRAIRRLSWVWKLIRDFDESHSKIIRYIQIVKIYCIIRAIYLGSERKIFISYNNLYDLSEQGKDTTLNVQIKCTMKYKYTGYSSPNFISFFQEIKLVFLLIMLELL